MKILVVDDSAVLLSSMKQLLARAGYDNVVSAGSAEDAYSILRIDSDCKSDIDLILMDIVMPGVDGLEACSVIKSNDNLVDIPVIMVTASTRSEDLKLAFECGADDYITKPLNEVELYSRVRAALKLKHETKRRKKDEKDLLNLTEKLASSNEKLRSYEKAIETMQIGVTIADAEGKILYANPAEAEMHQYGRDELVGQDVRIFAPRELWDPMKKVDLSKIGSFKRETVNLRKDGSSFSAQLLSDVVSNDAGEPIALVTTCEDITERKLAESELKKSREELELRVGERTSELTSANEALKAEIEERNKIEVSLRKSEAEFRNLFQLFNTLLEAIPDALILFSPALTVLWFNKGATKVFEFDEDDIKGRHCKDLRKMFKHDSNCPVERSLKSGREEFVEIVSKKGKRLNIRAFPIFDDGTLVNVLELAIDETEKISLQAEAMRAGRLASIGELSAGVAHEINNPVNGIINCAELIYSRSSNDEKIREISSMIITEGKRVARIVMALLSFARKRGEKKSPVNLNDVLRDSLSLTGAHLRKDSVILKIDFPESLPEIYGNDQQIEQVFLNFINNSRYALNEKYPKSDDDKILEIKAKEMSVRGKAYIEMQFRDHGTGIKDNVIEKVLDPFFSTKPQKEGTGLGLSISHGIINDHEGTMTINSKEGKFTEISVRLPVVER